MTWPQEFFDWRAGIGCPMCDGRPAADEYGVRILAGKVSDAYLVRSDIQRGMSVVIWRGRHVAELTELTEGEVTAYWSEVLSVGRAIEGLMEPIKMNYSVLGNAVPHLHTHVVPRFASDPLPGHPLPFPSPRPPDMPAERLWADVLALRSAITADRMSRRHTPS